MKWSVASRKMPILVNAICLSPRNMGRLRKHRWRGWRKPLGWRVLVIELSIKK